MILNARDTGYVILLKVCMHRTYMYQIHFLRAFKFSAPFLCKTVLFLFKLSLYQILLNEKCSLGLDYPTHI